MNGQQLLIIFCKPEWNVTTASVKCEICRNIHIELNWTPKLKKMSLFIHYETNPYKTQKEIEESYKEDEVKQFERGRKFFKDELYNHMTKGWKKIGRCLTMIKTNLPIQSETTYEEIETWLTKEVLTACDCITKTLSVIHNID